MASALSDRSVEDRRQRAVAAITHFNARDFEALSGCLADVVTSIRPERNGDKKSLTALDRYDFIEQLKKERESKGALTILEIAADRGLVSLVIQFEDGSLGSHIIQFTKDDMIERTFMRPGISKGPRSPDRP